METAYTSNDNPAEIAALFAYLDAPAEKVAPVAPAAEAVKPDIDWLTREFAAHPEAEFRMVFEVERPMPPTRSFGRWVENPQFFATVEDMQRRVDAIQENCASRGEQLWRVRALDRQGADVPLRYTRPQYRIFDFS